MKQAEMLLKKEEQVIFSLRALFEQYGYKKFKMSKFEEYDFYADNRSFLSSETILAFTGLDGKLLALKPDVTLSIVKNTKGSRDAAERVYYNENVYRARKGAGEYKEIMQVGLECIGDIDLYNICEVIMLAIKSLSAISNSFVLDISHMGLVSQLLSEATDSERTKAKLLKCLGEKNLHEIRRICGENGLDSTSLELICSVYGTGDEVVSRRKSADLSPEAMSHVESLSSINEFLKSNSLSGNVNFDFSIDCDMKYYSSVVFKGYIQGISESVLLGGQYGKLLARMGKKADAIGFAVYLDMLERLSEGGNSYDADTIIIYDDSADVCELSKCIKKLTDTGISVLAVKSAEGLRYRQLLKFEEVGTVETNG